MLGNHSQVTDEHRWSQDLMSGILQWQETATCWLARDPSGTEEAAVSHHGSKCRDCHKQCNAI